MMPTTEDLKRAKERVKPYTHKTIVLTSKSINSISGSDIYFKCENFQKMGAFKMRGAANAVALLSDERKEKGVTTHSSGNFAQALALAAKSSSIKAFIIMPNNAPEVKKKAVAGYGAEIIECGPTITEREAMLEIIVEKTGATFVPPFNDNNVIAGNATSAMELIDECPDLDYIITPVGGGGLISGTALACQYFSSNTKVIGAEPELAKDAYDSIVNDKIMPAYPPKTIADGLRTSHWR